MLKRALGLWHITLMGIGVILGAGIYVIIGEAAGLSSNGLWLSVILASIVAALTGLSYAELSSRFPEAGAEYVYVEKSFGDTAAGLTGWLIIVGSIIAAAAVSVGFAKYFSALFHTPILLIAIATLIVCGVILIAGIKETAFITILFTLIEASGLFLIIFIGVPYFGSIDYLELAQGLNGVIKAGVLIFFSYIGFENIARLAEETKEPEKNMPRAILLSISITTVIYVLVGIAALSVVSWQELAQAEAPLALIAQRVYGDRLALVLSVIALFSTFNTVLVTLLSSSRIIYGIAAYRALPRIFLSTAEKLQTPWIAIIAVVGVSIPFVFLGDLATIANLANFTIFIIFIMVNASVIYFRYKRPVETGFKTPLTIGRFPILPFLGLLTALFMLFYLPIKVLSLGFVLIILGLLIPLALKIHVNEALFRER
ncbi:MAG: APC family permease [Candidatus Methanospirareceae archaeon]